MYKTAFKYTIFAAIATITNLGIQFLTIKIINIMAINFLNNNLIVYVAMLTGTFFGLIVKYVLDKKYIFYYSVNSKTEDIKKFIIYSIMGIATTVIFWGTELLFHYLWKSDISKYIGGALGLLIGYTTKYFLDKHFVFKKKIEIND